ncbi:MAG: RidA family protein [Rubrivivax sp.]
MQRHILKSKALPAPRFRYSPVVQAGPFVFISGMVPLDPATGQLVAGGAFEQSAQVLANLKALADEMYWSLEQLLVARIFCSDFADFAEINRAWEAVFDGIEPPARTTVGVNALPLGARVEMEFQFVVDDTARA